MCLVVLPYLYITNISSIYLCYYSNLFILQICLLIIRMYNSKWDTDKEKDGTSYTMLRAGMTREDAEENKLELLIVLIHKSKFVSWTLEAINASDKSFE